MKNRFKILPFLLALMILFSCDGVEPGQIFGKVTEAEIAAGLKEALKVGAEFALNKLGVTDGFYKDLIVKIGVPEDAANLIKAAVNIPIVGNTLKALEEELVLTMNRAAEASIKEVIPIVLNAITDMSIQDASAILFSSNQIAATDYLYEKTYAPLCNVCISVIEGALNRKIVGNTSAQDVWGTLTGYYNTVAPLVPSLNPIETDLSTYATQKTLDGVFVKVGGEEVKIRTDVSARISDLLRRVFGQLDN
jgi:hypothetical protein